MAGTSAWNFQWQSPSLSPQPRDLYGRFLESVDKNYVRAFAAGDIEVLTPRD